MTSGGTSEGGWQVDEVVTDPTPRFSTQIIPRGQKAPLGAHFAAGKKNEVGDNGKVSFPLTRDAWMVCF